MHKLSRQIAAVAASLLASSAHATLIAADSYRIGADNAAGQYPAGSSLSAANTTRVNTGFANGRYANGTGTSNFVVSSTSATPASPIATAGGRVFFTGLSATDTSVNRTNSRLLATASNFAAGTSYFTSQILTRGANAAAAPSAGAFVGLGFGNSVTPTPGISFSGTTAASLSGAFLGFAGTGAATDFGSLVIRARTASTPTGQNVDTVIIDGATTSTENQTYFIVTKVASGINGGIDGLSYWVNPTDLSSEGQMTATAAYTNANAPLNFFGPQGTGGDVDRLTFADTVNTPFGTAATGVFRGTALFDEPRLGTTLADVTPAPVPEPTTLVAVAGAGLTLLRRRRRRRA